MLRRYCPPTSKNAVGQLTQRAHPRGAHQLVEHVAVAGRHVLQPPQRLLGLAAVPPLEVREPLELGLLLRLGGAGMSSISTGAPASGSSGLRNVLTPIERQRHRSCLRCS
jgi:hypothetical protein